MIQIAVVDENDSLTEVVLDEETFFLHLAWNSEAEFWTLGIENASKDTIIEGIAVVPDYPLLDRYRGPGMPAGDIIAVAPDRRDGISRSDLPEGIVALVYVTAADLKVIAALPPVARKRSIFIAAGGAAVVSPPPDVPPSMDTAAGLLAYINSIVGTKVISGQFVERGYSLGMDPITDVHTATGKWVGILGGDYYWYGSPGPADTNFNTAAIAHHAAGGIITLSIGMPNPTTGGGIDDTSALNVADLLVSGTPTNVALITALDQIAVGLAQLRDADVPVLLRPFHELNGNWYWYGTTFLSDAQSIALWRYVHGYFTFSKGLNNLLWTYGVNAGLSITSRYPGAGFVDTVGFDYYGDNPGPDLAADYVSLAALGKPMWMTEFGSGDPSGGNLSFDERVLTTALAVNMPNLFAWQQWWDANGGGNGWGLSSVTQATAALATARVLNRDDLP